MRLSLCFGLVLLGACTAFPQLDDRIDAAARAAPYPQLAPIGPVLDQAARGSSAAADQSDLTARAARLAARAAALRGPVVDGGTRSTMAAGVDTTALQ